MDATRVQIKYAREQQKNILLTPLSVILPVKMRCFAYSVCILDGLHTVGCLTVVWQMYHKL